MDCRSQKAGCRLSLAELRTLGGKEAVGIGWRDGEHSMTEADIIIIAAAIVVVGILIAGVIANAAHQHEDRRRFGPRQR